MAMFDVFKKSNRRPLITDELLIDIYANAKMRGLAILIDRPFKKKLQRLELDLNNNYLIFVFDEGDKKDLGTPLKDELVPFFIEREQVKFNIMDIKTLAAKESFMVPLKLINEDSDRPSLQSSS